MDIEQTRVSTTERERALADLRRHFEAGRLPSFEYEDRRGRAGDALVRSELEALFADLPRADAADAVAVRSSAPSDERQADAVAGRGSARCFSQGAAYSWVPLLAVALFFITGSWVWFLMIPAVGFIAGSRSGAGSRAGTRRTGWTRS